MTESPQAPYVLFLGAHPAISASEAWGVLMRHSLDPTLLAVSRRFLIVTTSAPISAELFAQIGGLDRIGTIVQESAKPIAPEEAASHLSPPPKGKMAIGVSWLGLPSDFGIPFARELKKVVKAAGGRMNFITPKKGSQINAAQILFNALLENPNAELTIMQHEGTHYLVKTVHAQDIQAYERRDTSRPARDARVGMLPPKLAQMMLNIAIAQVPEEAPLTIADPFCGLGTVLQEGWLMGHQMIGSDDVNRMTQASAANMTYLASEFPVRRNLKPKITEHDAGEPWPEAMHNTLQAVVTEPYLGPPQSSLPSPEEAEDYGDKLSRLYHRTFVALRDVLTKDGVVLFLLPAFRVDHGDKGFTFLPESFLDEIAAVGYRRLHLVPEELQQEIAGTERGTLLYARPDAIVGRELTLWQRTND